MADFTHETNLTMGSNLRGELTATNDELKMQEIQLSCLTDEVLEDVERFQNYGFTSNPQNGAEVLLASLGADRSHSVALVVDDRRYRFKAMAKGEVAIYTDEGDVIHFKRGNTIEIHTKHIKAYASEDVLIDTPFTHITGDVKIDKNLLVVGNMNVLAQGAENENTTSTFNGTIHIREEVLADQDVIAQTISLVNHVHTGDSNGTTSKPRG